MMKSYLSKVLFTETVGCGISIDKVLLNIPLKELSYEKAKLVRKMPAIEGNMTFEYNGRRCVLPNSHAAMYMKNGKTGFKPVLLIDDNEDEDNEDVKVIKSYGIKLSDKQIKELLPYCVSDDFQAFIGKKMEMFEPGYIGYRDEVHMKFKAVTDEGLFLSYL